MLKRVVYALVGVLGLVLIGLGIASATIWRADDVLVATGTSDAPIVVTDPGVLEMAGDPVTVRATVPAGGHVALVVGRDFDVDGWVGGDEHARVTGMTGWHELTIGAPAAIVTPSPTGPTPAGSPTATATPTPTPTATPTPTPTPTSTEAAAGGAAGGETAASVPDPYDSDMWVARAEGTATATLTWAARDGRWSLLVVGTDADGDVAAPTLELAWPRVVTTPWLVPAVVAGSLLVLLSLALFARDWWRVRRHPEHAEWTPVVTGAIPLVGVDGAPVPVPTRRQLREQARGGTPTGSVPVVTGAVPAVDEHAPDDLSATAPVPVVPAQPFGADRDGHDDGTADVGAERTATPARPGSRRALREAAARASGVEQPSPEPARPATSRPEQTPPVVTTAPVVTTLSAAPTPPFVRQQPVPSSGAGSADRPPTDQPTVSGAHRPSWVPAAAAPAATGPAPARPPAAPPAPGGWTPVAPASPAVRPPGAAPSSAWAPTAQPAPRPAPRPTAPAPERPAGRSSTGPASAPAAAPSAHPRWVFPPVTSTQDVASPPASPSALPGGLRPTERAGAEHSGDVSESARAAAWRRAWGLPAADGTSTAADAGGGDARTDGEEDR